MIFLTPDWIESGIPDAQLAYRLSARCIDAVGDAGGFALVLPPRGDMDVAEAVALADGIVITGSDPGMEVGEPRSLFERDLVAEALRCEVPLLGICHGMQIIGAAFGGTIQRDLPDLLAPGSMHLPHPMPDRLAHEVTLAPSSRLAAWQGATQARVNSLHRHALDDTGRARVVATAPDGVVEAIEGPGPGFCVGVQWHPEYRLTALDRAIWQGFVAACAETASVLEARN